MKTCMCFCARSDGWGISKQEPMQPRGGIPSDDFIAQPAIPPKQRSLFPENSHIIGTAGKDQRLWFDGADSSKPN
jgi:hypothetical protein